MQNILKSVNKTFYITELLIHYNKLNIIYSPCQKWYLSNGGGGTMNSITLCIIVNNVLSTSSVQSRLEELIKRQQLAIYHHQSKNGHSLIMIPVENMIAFRDEHAQDFLEQ